MADIPKYNTLYSSAYANVSDVGKLLNSTKDSVVVFNIYFMMLFGLLLILSTASYYSQIRLVGNQSFLNSLLAGSFATTIISILFSLAELVTVLHVMTFIAISVTALAFAAFYK